MMGPGDIPKPLANTDHFRHETCSRSSAVERKYYNIMILTQQQKRPPPYLMFVLLHFIRHMPQRYSGKCPGGEHRETLGPREWSNVGNATTAVSPPVDLLPPLCLLASRGGHVQSFLICDSHLIRMSSRSSMDRGRTGARRPGTGNDLSCIIGSCRDARFCVSTDTVR